MMMDFESARDVLSLVGLRLREMPVEDITPETDMGDQAVITPAMEDYTVLVVLALKQRLGIE